jgi:hypothetical protein
MKKFINVLFIPSTHVNSLSISTEEYYASQLFHRALDCESLNFSMLFMSFKKYIIKNKYALLICF